MDMFKSLLLFSFFILTSFFAESKSPQKPLRIDTSPKGVAIKGFVDARSRRMREARSAKGDPVTPVTPEYRKPRFDDWYILF